MNEATPLRAHSAAPKEAAFDSDWHLHSCHSCDCKDAPHPCTLAETIEQRRRCGVRDAGVTDHVYTPYNLPDLEASRQAFDALPTDPHLHFGVEVSCVSVWELNEVAAGSHAAPVYGVRSGGPAGGPLAIGLTAEDVARLRIEYVVGGTHWPLYVPLEREAVIRDYQRQNLFLACHPLVTIVAHPWWWMGHWRDADGMYRTGPWLDNFDAIPRSMHDEFAAAAREHDTAVEINLCAMLLNRHYPERFRRQYCEYLAALKADGVALSLGSDHHAQHSTYAESVGGESGVPFAEAAALLAAVGIDADDLWRLPPRTS